MRGCISLRARRRTVAKPGLVGLVKGTSLLCLPVPPPQPGALLVLWPQGGCCSFEVASASQKRGEGKTPVQPADSKNGSSGSLPHQLPLKRHWLRKGGGALQRWGSLRGGGLRGSQRREEGSAQKLRNPQRGACSNPGGLPGGLACLPV